MTVLGIDYGLKRVGVAISDEGEGFAFPLKVLQNQETLEGVLDICKEKGVIHLVLGESKDFKGQDNQIMSHIQTFKDQLLEKAPHLQIHFEPEWMTTQQAERFQGKRDDIDASAAAVILQSYLDRKNHERTNN